MKILKLKQMEVLIGGDDCSDALFGTAGIATAIVIAGAITGGIGWAVGALLWTWAGAATTAVVCAKQ